MENDLFYRLIANPRRLKKNNNYNNYDDELLNLIKKMYDNYDITNESYEKIKKSIENILINNEINLIVDNIIRDVNTQNE